MGIRKKIQTENSMLTLNTVPSKCKKIQKNMYTVFVDFTKFYDSINRNLLFSNKLPFTNAFVLTESFSPNIGLKHGFLLSPTLANIFLHDILEEYERHHDSRYQNQLNSLGR